jgi:hypothetical protein
LVEHGAANVELGAAAEEKAIDGERLLLEALA